MIRRRAHDGDFLFRSRNTTENQVATATTAAAAPVSTSNPYGLQALWASGDIIARAVLILLLIMSLASWYVMLTKLWDQRKLKQSARVVEKQFWTAPSVKDGEIA